MIDMHCDVLMKLWEEPHKSFSDDDLHISYNKWLNSPVQVQYFAIFVPPETSQDYFQSALEMIDLFHEKIIKPYPGIKWVQTKEEVEALSPHEKGAVLTLEGCHVIGEDLMKLRTLLRLGVRAVGLTWNNVNALSGTCVEDEELGLTTLGKAAVKTINEYNAFVDCSHLSPAGIDDVLELADRPMISHSNAKAIYQHERNISDQQLKQFFEQKAPVGITFVPYFTAKDGVNIEDLLNHINHMYELGGRDSISFGSDFDGMSETIQGLEDIEAVRNLYHKLAHHYSSDDVYRMRYDNAVRFL
ncbi:dipeptidase [Alkalibacillus salilacus]|uniref:Membrane dipeptidase n=1 Tax=Alkalibacillus salilacus TaxID=284582 RepID=A0ABT9VDH8_9BACI|nr:membrane dipeptidase [Alkalibacillus salilacus]MDQ0159021.1 membrane dipeptidase [Alkalibacillus salilacus]